MEAAMLRTLTTVSELLVREGAPAVRRETGSGHIDTVLVSVAAPWQQSAVRTESVQQERPFVFTTEFARNLVAKHAQMATEHASPQESIIATRLDGHEIPNPFGKKASRVELIILSSSITRTIAERIEGIVSAAYHTHTISFVAFASAAYVVFRDLYPHERDFLILDVSGEGSDVAMIKNGHLTDVGSIPHGLHTPKEWLAGVITQLGDFSTRHALPQTLFLLTEDAVRDTLLHALDTSELRRLWLSDERLRIVPVLPAPFAAHVQTKGEATGDIFLAILALYRTKTVQTLN